MKSKEAFTIIELLAVIAVIGILAGFTLRGLLGATDKAKIGRAKAEIGEIHNAILQLEVDTGCWPKTPNEETCKIPGVIESGYSNNEIWDLNNLYCGLTGNEDGVFRNWFGPYMKKVPKDPWDNNYFFDTDYDIDPGEGETWAVVIGSFGPNGEGQNLYDEDDIIFILIEE